MSKKMTPCERLGYKVGDKFTVIKDSYFEKGAIVALSEDDGSEVPWFTRGGVRRALIIGSNPDVEPTPSKLKPAKQALADAIHKNGGWRGGCYAVFGKVGGRCIFCDEKPYFSRDAKCWYVHADKVVGAFSMKPFVNWHQCILSRDEYFTAYPEQGVEIISETKQKVDVEMKSESEMTIKVRDWHKSGELPPVGEVCIFDPAGGECYFNEDELCAKGHKVSIIAHTKYKKGSGSVAVFKWDLDECCGVSSANACSFRPLRTGRDKAIDEMVCEFIDHHGDPKGGERYIGIATKLYDSGYRKEVK